jgi:hypothetical protein
MFRGLKDVQAFDHQGRVRGLDSKISGDSRDRRVCVRALAPLCQYQQPPGMRDLPASEAQEVLAFTRYWLDEHPEETEVVSIQAAETGGTGHPGSGTPDEHRLAGVSSRYEEDVSITPSASH